MPLQHDEAKEDLNERSCHPLAQSETFDELAVLSGTKAYRSPPSRGNSVSPLGHRGNLTAWALSNVTKHPEQNQWKWKE